MSSNDSPIITEETVDLTEQADNVQLETEVEAAIRSQNDALMHRILEDKRGEPNKYASVWEMDEENVEQWSPDEIEGDPTKQILVAAENGNYELVEKLVKSNGELANARDNDGYTPLHRAAYGGHCRTADLLLSLGAKVGARTNDGWTPLHSAAHWDQRDMCELLLNLGADPNEVTEGGNTPLHCACLQPTTPRTIALLLGWKYIQRDVRNAQGDTPRAICERHCAFAKQLFD